MTAILTGALQENRVTTVSGWFLSQNLRKLVTLSSILEHIDWNRAAETSIENLSQKNIFTATQTLYQINHKCERFLNIRFSVFFNDVEFVFDSISSLYAWMNWIEYIATNLIHNGYGNSIFGLFCYWHFNIWGTMAHGKDRNDECCIRTYLYTSRVTTYSKGGRKNVICNDSTLYPEREFSITWNRDMGKSTV